MSQELVNITVALGSALVAGSLIGLERTYHGRPAGFRTHALVCVASALLMLVAVYQLQWFGVAPRDTIRIDPTRMAQGIMTGIGFLGAGVIFKEGLTVRGLTTAASIWITAALGILYGIGFYYAAVVGTLVTLGVLGGFRWFERRMPGQYFAHLEVSFPKDRVPGQDDLEKILGAHGFTMSNLSFVLGDAGETMTFQTIIRTTDAGNTERLSTSLLARDDVLGFSILPTGD